MHPSLKGDQGVGFVMATLLAHRIQVALPVSEYLPFDLIAISPEGKLRKVSVKYRQAKSDKIETELVRKPHGGSGKQRRAVTDSEIDGVALYCPDTGQCYFIRMDQVKGQVVTLRLKPPGNGQTKGIKMASDFTDPYLLFQ
jgi:hypothetical protein